MADIGLPASTLDQPVASLSGGQAARTSVAAILLAGSTSSCSTSRPTTSTSPGSNASSGSSPGCTSGVVIVSHDRAFLERTITSVLEIDEHRPPARRSTTAAGSPTSTRERPLAVTQEEAYAEYTTEARRSSWTRAPEAAAVGGAGRGTAVKRSRGHRTRTSTRFRIASSEKQAAKVKITEQALERLDVGRQAVGGLGAAARDRGGTAEWRRRRSASTTRSSTEARSRSVPSTSRSAGPSGSRSSGRTAAARRRCSARCSVGCR